ncbi:MAG: phosphoribosyl-ATP diphosphatase [Alphaproteobacteria bacterium]|nr:phosphoribosyl-ATP diphosphatase [Alphaproteobacteria bacterium]MCZ6840603.1 phosphoribosyl-ATP diphosphatase [Alphaproteobacteria bacterium]
MVDDKSATALDRLFAVIEARRSADPSSSYTAKLLAGGTLAITAKITEEAAETVAAALAEGPEALTRESADLLYHLCVLWADQGVRPEDVWAELTRREGVSGIVEKASRGQNGDTE